MPEQAPVVPDPRRVGVRVVVEVLVLWVVAVGAALVVAATTKIGPTLVELTFTHGVHVGDVAFVIGAVVACTIVTWGRLRRA